LKLLIAKNLLDNLDRYYIVHVPYFVQGAHNNNIKQDISFLRHLVHSYQSKQGYFFTGTGV